MESGCDIAGARNPVSRRRNEFYPQSGGGYPARPGLWQVNLLISVSLGLLLSACSSASVIDNLPSSIAEPAGAPKRTVGASEFPAVHDTPSPRAAATLSAEEQKKAESELVAARETQKTGTIPPPPAAAAPVKPVSPAIQTAKKKPGTPAATREATAGSDPKP
jgi:hypothetical protein